MRAWRWIALSSCCFALGGCASSAHRPRADGCPPDAYRLHLGDGTTDYHYFPIRDFLREHPGSTAEADALEREEREAAASPGSLKPPSSGILETELSHLVGIIARANGGIGGAVFDDHGMMVAVAGVVPEGVVLSADRLETLKHAGDESPVEVRYPDLRSSGASVQGYYRPVLDHERESQFLGIGVIVTRERPPCSSRRTTRSATRCSPGARAAFCSAP